MSYIAAISIDFGSTNSGCAGLRPFGNETIKYDKPEFFYHTGSYPKDNTWFFLSPEFVDQIINDYENIQDDDFRIESPVSHHNSPNVIWGRKSIKQFYPLIKNDGWVQFRWFKMDFLHGTTYSSNRLPLDITIRVFFRILKIERLRTESARLKRDVAVDEILWGVTVPSVLNDSQKKLMLTIVHQELSPQTRLLSEPEGPLVSSLIHGSALGRADFVNNRVTLVIDCGGGTTDICFMKENTSGEIPTADMVSRTDGSVAGGNDIDNAFYLYFLRTISRGKISDNGVVYDRMNDQDLFGCLFDKFRIDEPKSFMDFEDDWLELKSSNDFEDENYPTCSFEIRPSYKKWLRNNGHVQVSEFVDVLIEDGCEFSKKELVEKVFNPTFDIICNKIEEIILNNKQVKIDRIVPAGGMSCNSFLNTRIKRLIVKLLGVEAVHKVAEMAAEYAGGSIMDGALYVLLNKGFVRRIANKTYYYDYIGLDTNSEIKSVYNGFGVNLKIGEIENIRCDEEKYQRKTESDKGVMLQPITIQNRLVRNFSYDLFTGENQKRLNITFFSSQDKFVLYSNIENPDLALEGEINVEECRPNCHYRLEVDFNEAQIAGALHYTLIESESSQIVADDFVYNVLKS